jgi:hypothetical protein
MPKYVIEELMIAKPTPEELAEIARWSETSAPVPEEDEELDLLAIEAWQRGSCPKKAAEEEWLGVEATVLMPH